MGKCHKVRDRLLAAFVVLVGAAVLVWLLVYPERALDACEECGEVPAAEP